MTPEPIAVCFKPSRLCRDWSDYGIWRRGSKEQSDDFQPQTRVSALRGPYHRFYRRVFRDPLPQHAATRDRGLLRGCRSSLGRGAARTNELTDLAEPPGGESYKSGASWRARPMSHQP